MKRKYLILAGTLIFSLAILSGCSSNKNVVEDMATTDNVTTKEAATTEKTRVEESTEKNKVDTESETQDKITNSKDMIGEKKAINIVLKRIPGATKSDVRIHLDRDDGIDIYEGSVVYDKIEYDFEIDAKTGDVLEWESESIYD